MKPKFANRREALTELKRERRLRDQVYPKLMDPSRANPLHPELARKQNERLDTAIAVFEVLNEREFRLFLERYRRRAREGGRQQLLDL